MTVRINKHWCAIILGISITMIAWAKPFEVSPAPAFGSETRQGEIISRFEARFSAIDTITPTRDDFEVAMGLNYSMARRTEFPTVEIALRAEKLTDDLENFFKNNTSYPEIIHARVLEIQHLKETQKTTTYEMDMIRSFRLIEFLPTPEVVIMLGSLLEHDDGFFVDGRLTKGIHNGNASIAGRSIRTLLKFPLVDGPERPPPSHPAWYDSDMIAPEWQAWWQEILDGERTFQLEGDPNRYNHLGPVSADWKPKSAALTASQPSPATTATTARTPAPKSSAEPEIKAQGNRYLWAGLALVAIAVLTWVKTRIQRAPSRTS